MIVPSTAAPPSVFYIVSTNHIPLLPLAGQKTAYWTGLTPHRRTREDFTGSVSDLTKPGQQCLELLIPLGPLNSYSAAHPGVLGGRHCLPIPRIPAA
jgi:hypothetical protein